MRPKVTIVAGPNGSGKSTLIEELQSKPEYEFPAAYINADDIEREFAARNPLPKRELEQLAFREARDLRVQYRNSLTSHAFETVFSHASNLVDMQRLKPDFHVELYVVSTLQPKLNVTRVARRVAGGGHPINEEKIVARYARSLRFWPLAADLADSTFVFDNSSRMTLVGSIFEGVWNQISATVPDYLQKSFVEVFLGRASEREALFSQPEYEDARHVVHGTHIGKVLHVGQHYLLQEVDGAHFIHDSIWLDHEIQTDWTGQEVTITYGAGDYGLASVNV